MLKYYVYMSATTIAMLYPQIPPAFLKGAEAELKVNLGVISTGIKARGPEDVKELPAQVAAVESYLRSQKQVGTPDDPNAWIGGAGLMRWGRVWEYASDIAFFGGSQGQTTVALLGSSESIIGAPAQAESNHAPFYYTMRFFNQILEKGRVKIGDEWEDSGESQGDEPPPCYSYSDSVKIAYEALNGSEAKLEYLAFVLHKQRQLIVATPLYVAMVHE